MAIHTLRRLCGVVATVIVLATVLATAAGFALEPQWPQAFHGVRNSGQAIVKGPGGPGTCDVDLIPQYVDPDARFYHTGVLSLDNTRIYTAGSQNSVFFVTLDNQDLVDFDLGDGNRVTGVVADPAVAEWGHTRSERLYVGSTDTYMYSLNTTACMSMSQAGCIAWKQRLNNPIMAPVHHTMYGINPTVHTNGVVYVSTSSNVSDDQVPGRLYQLDANTGVSLWHRDATDGTNHYPIHSAPAIDTCTTFKGVLYMAMGNRLLALDAADGSIITELDTNETLASDPFQSSPALSSDCKNIYIQSRSRTVWFLSVTGTTLTNMKINLVRRCSYSTTTPSCCVPPACHVTELQDLIDREPPAPPNVDGPALTNVYSTPALNFDDSAFAVAFTQPFIPVAGQAGGVWYINAQTGQTIWKFTQFSGIDFGSSRSSATIDPDGAVFIASDTNKEDSTLPVLFAIEPSGALRFAAQLADVGVVLGRATPIINRDINGASFAIISGGNKVRSFSQGVLCPTNSLNPLEECSGNGACNCRTGLCDCSDDCFVDAACAVINDCNNHGFCSNGACLCDACYDGPNCDPDTTICHEGKCVLDPQGGGASCQCNSCYNGEFCENEVTCSEHGTCVATTTTSYSCECMDGWHGSTCETANTPNDPGDGGSGGVVAAVVIIFLVGIGVGVWMLMQWRSGRGLFKPKRRMRRGRRTLDVIYEEEEEDEDSTSHTALGGRKTGGYGATNYTEL